VISSGVIVIEKYGPVLARLGLRTLEEFKNYEADVIQPDRREVLRIEATDEDGRKLLFFMKRNWRSSKKNGLMSLLRRGRVWSLAREEWENFKTMQCAGLRTAALVAYAEECGPLWEKFSCLVTEAAIGPDNLEAFLQQTPSPGPRRRIFDALAREVRRMHEAGVATPDFWSRHIFFDATASQPVFCFIDLARLDVGQPLSRHARVRALASLNVSAPMRLVSLRERLRFLRLYAGRPDRKLVGEIKQRTERLLERNKYPEFLTPAPASEALH
jgi:hypothetical protein